MTSMLEYKGHQASVEYEDGRVVIQLRHIDGFISTAVEAASKVEQTFRELMDEYFADCTAKGRAPKKPFKGSFNVRAGPEMHRQISMAAAEDGVSLTQWVMTTLAERIAARHRVETARPAATPFASMLGR